jgi:anti-anti-sigma regulatory factor
VHPRAESRSSNAAPTNRPPTLVIDVGGVRAADVGTIGALARVALDARRRGDRIQIVGASPELVELLALSGLTRVLGLGRRSVQPAR